MARDITLPENESLRARVRSIVIDLDAKLVHLTVERVNKQTLEVETTSVQAVGSEFEAFATAGIPVGASNMYQAVQGAAWTYLEGLGAERIAGAAGASFDPPPGS